MPGTPRKRRHRGEGSIFQRGDGLWVGKLSVKFGGLSKRRTVYGKTLEDCRDKMERLRANRTPTTKKTTVGQFMTNTWLPEMKKTNAHSTWEKYESTVRLHVLPAIGDIRLSDVVADTLVVLDDFLIKGKRSTAMRKEAYGRTAQALKFAKTRKLITDNPCADGEVEAPRHERKEINPLTVADAQRFIKAAKSDTYGPLYLLALLGGLRQGELFGLKPGDVDLVRGTVAVRRSLREGPNGVEERPPKTKAGRRSVYVPNIALIALRDHMATLPKDAPYLFLAEKGGPLRKSVFVRKSWQPFLKRAGFPPFNFHQLRHTAATLRMQAGVPARVTQETLGHADVGTTLNTYSHVAQTMQKEGANSVDGLLSGGSQGPG